MSEEKPQVVDKRRLAVQGEPILALEGWQEIADSVQRAANDLDPEMEAAALKAFDEPNFSPSSDPNKPIGMDFSTAIQQVLEGKRVTRLEWGNPDEYLLMFMWGQMNPKTPAGKYLSVHHADGAVNPLCISDGDLAGDDWVVVV